jgi:haloacetate dehalogenase
MIDRWEERRIAGDGAEIYVRIGGSGPPLVCLHGYPQTHLTWRKVAPLLAERFTVVLPDLRGYGASEVVASDAAHAAYGKRAMARDVVALMRALGHERFFLAGHDRGARVAYRLALDLPERVAAVATLDIVPTIEQWESMDDRSAYGSYHWPFLAQPEPLPERLIGVDPRWYCRWTIASWLADPAAIDAATMAAYEDAFAQPGHVHAACEDYRAGYTFDREADRVDREAGTRIAMPLLALWGAGSSTTRSARFRAVWERWADDLTTQALPCGHFVMEELPLETADALGAFFDTHRTRL